MKITEDKLISPPDGFTLLEIDRSAPLKLAFDFQHDCNVLIRINEATELSISGKVAPERKVTVFYWNDTKDRISTSDSYEVGENGILDLGYLECNSAATDKKIEVSLNGRKAYGSVSTASLLTVKKDYSINVINNEKETTGQIRNYAVVLNKGKLTIDAIGKIIRGAKRSKSHQVSRALSFEKGQEATILPELLIDENDVEASHALSIGRMDENQLYYMMSRGLDLKECQKLVSLGYLLPICEIIEDEEFRQKLAEDLERKITELCLM